jgi:hypothetical protein
MIARKIILLVGSLKDPHVQGVRDDLLRLGAQPIILDRYSTTDTLNYQSQVKLHCNRGRRGYRGLLRSNRGMVAVEADGVLESFNYR